MRICHPLFQVFSALCLFAGIVTAQSNENAPSAVQPLSPNAFLPHRLGDNFTPHHLLNTYFEQLAAEAPSTMRLEKYGITYEGRPLQVAIFSSPENVQRLEQIRVSNLRLAGMAPGEPDLSEPVAIVWISMSIHGNEPSGSECSMELAYRLAVQRDEKIKKWLQNTVVILDPSLNPDGYDRYTHWYRMAANQYKNTDVNAREHQEPWPGGRVNHYYFDLNRDWAWATQKETQQRLHLYHRWLPHVHPDLHEQGINDPYYFAPAAEPMHELITQWQREFQAEIGENNARHFDNHGWLYFTKEIFDLFYPSYGDTYSSFNGAVGMTYEQAGGSKGALAVEIDNNDTLTLHDRIEHHLTTSLATIEISSKNAKLLVENFKEYFRRSAKQPQGQYKTFVVRESNDPNKVQSLCDLLNRHHIRYGRVGMGYSGIKAFDYATGKEISASINPNDLLISAYQPHSVLVQALLEPEPKLEDSLTYDITAWSLLFAYGLDALAIKERIDAKKIYEPYHPQKDLSTDSPYAWCVRRGSMAAFYFLSELLREGVQVRVAAEPFLLADQRFDAGTFVITKADNKGKWGGMDTLVAFAAEQANVRVHPVFSGSPSKGKNLGSEAFQLLKVPKIALVYGDEVDENGYGQFWHFFEQELDYAVTPVSVSKLHKIALDRYNTLILPNGRYNLSEKQMEALRSWIERGGRLIVVEGALRAFADKDEFVLKTKEIPKRDSITTAQRPFMARHRDELSDGLPGAILQVKVDTTHPVAFGFSSRYHTLKTNSDVYKLPENAETPFYVDECYTSYGFIGSRLRPMLKSSPVVSLQRLGSGEVVFFVDNPLFRGFWQQGKHLFANTLFR